MPKETGFDLYALVVHYKDGNKCICYARKTDDWFYFSDKMDFRIKLADDNKTITQQEWRRKHYESSWYESGLLDYVELMQFGEEYLQSELNPMRDDIYSNHENIVINEQTIEENYNKFINSENDIWSVVNAESMSQYIDTMRLIMSALSSEMKLYISYYNDALTKLVDNYNSLVEAISQITKNLVITENTTKAVRRKTAVIKTYDSYDMTSLGFIEPFQLEIVEVEDNPQLLIVTDPAHYQDLIKQINDLQSTANSLSARVAALGG